LLVTDNALVHLLRPQLRFVEHKAKMKPSRLHFPRNKIALGIKAVTIILITIAIYFQDLATVANEAIRSEVMSHILAIPFLLAYLVYRKRKMLRATIPLETTNPTKKPIYTHEIVGALLCIIAFNLYLYGSYTFTPLEYHMISLPIFTAGLTLIIFNTKTLKVLAFPMAFLLFLTPPPLETVYAAGATLSTISSEAAYHMLKAIGLPVSLADQYGTPVIILQKPEGPLPFAIDIACAGIYSLIGFTIFTVFVAYIARGPAWKKATLFLAGFPLIYALNITRIIIIVLIGDQYGMETAMQAFHLLGGWVLIFLGTLILLTLSEKAFKIQLFTTKPKITPCNYCNQNPSVKQHFCAVCGKLLSPVNIGLSKRDLTKIFILTIGAILIANLQVPVFALTEGPTEVAIQTLAGEQTTTQVLPVIQGYATKFIHRDKEFEEIAKQDAALIYVYLPTDETKIPIWVTIEIAKTQSSLHRWEICLITYRETKGYQPVATQLDLQDVQISENPPIIGRYFAFQRINSDTIQVVLYWYENAFFNTGSSLEQKHVKISLIAYTKTREEVSLIGEQLLPFGKAIANHWQPVKTWSQIILTIAQHGDTLITITTGLLAITLALQAVKNQRERRSNLRVYNKLALIEEKLILQAVHQTAKEDKSTGNEIASCYQRLAGKPIESNVLLQKLNEAEEAGLVKREIISHNDEPVLIWKSQVPF